MSKDSTAKCYQDNKEQVQRKLMKDITVFQKKKIKKKQNGCKQYTKI